MKTFRISRKIRPPLQQGWQKSELCETKPKRRVNGESTFGTGNSFFGDAAGKANTTASGNSFFGRGTGSANSTGLDNSFFGSGAGLAINGSSNSFFGVNAGGLVQSGNGTDTIINRPTGGTIAFRENNTTQFSIASGGLVSIGKLGSGGTATLCRNASGQISTCAELVGEGPDTIVRSVTGGVVFRSVAGNLTLESTGLVRVGLLAAGGTTTLCTDGSNHLALCSSSVRYKTNISRFHPGLSLIKRLNPVSFNWKSDNATDFGLVAEDVAAVEPLLVTHNDTGQIEGVKYDRVGVVLINAVKEQQAQIEAQQIQIEQQQQTIKSQQQQIDQQKQDFEALRKVVCSNAPTAAFCQPRN